MKFHLGAPIETPGFPPDDSWRPVRAPGPVALQWQCLPVAVALVWFIGLAWCDATTAPDTLFFPWDIPTATFALCLTCALPLHELLHLASQPDFGLSNKSYMAFWPRKLLPYAQYEGPMSFWRRMTVLLTPFLMLTLVPWLLALVTCNSQSAFSMWYNHHTPTLAVFSVMNAALSSGDVLMAAKLYLRQPRNAVFQGSGWTLYSKTI